MRREKGNELDPFLEGTRMWKLSQGRDVKNVKTFYLYATRKKQR
jgi:hypothetical protein